MSAAAARVLASPVPRAQVTPAGLAAGVQIRPAVPEDLPSITRLIETHADEGRLLRRAPSDLAAHIGRFVVATHGERVIGCADLAPLSPDTAEVRSLVVSADARAHGIGQRLLTELAARAARERFARLTAFTHAPGFFVRAGFSVVPHTWVPEKIARDCHRCAEFRRCGQQAVILTLPSRVASGGPVHA